MCARMGPWWDGGVLAGRRQHPLCPLKTWLLYFFCERKSWLWGTGADGCVPRRLCPVGRNAQKATDPADTENRLCLYLNNFMTINSTAEVKQTNSLKDTNH